MVRRLWADNPAIQSDEDVDMVDLEDLEDDEDDEDDDLNDPPSLNAAEQQERDYAQGVRQVEFIAGFPPDLFANRPATPVAGMKAREQKQARLRQKRKEARKRENQAKKAAEVVRKARIRADRLMLEYRRYPLDSQWKPKENYGESDWGERRYNTSQSDWEPSYEKWVSSIGGPSKNKLRPLGPAEKRLQDEFMASEPIFKVTGDEGWKAKKFLGMGGMGMTGLWEYTGSNVVKYKCVVVKQSRTSKDGAAARTAVMADTIKSEGEFMNKWKHIDTTHLIKILWGPGIDRWTGVGRIIMEFCEQGDLKDLISNRIHGPPEPGHFSEEEIWQIFLCFAHGCSVLERGHECGKPQRQGIDNGREIAHMDIKPENIFMTDDNQHQIMPLAKIADYGIAFEVPEYMPYTDRLAYRPCGTWGYYVPEQFTNRWNCKGWDSWEVAGNYGSKSNIWQCAAIIFQMMTDGGPPPMPRSFKHPDQNIKGRTYGPTLEKTSYSKALKTIVYQCLCEKPADRPSIDELYAAIQTGIGAQILDSLTTGMSIMLSPVNSPSRTPSTMDRPTTYQPDHKWPTNELSPKRQKKREDEEFGLLTPDHRTIKRRKKYE